MDLKLLSYIPRDDIYLFNTGKAQKAWLCFGCRYIPELSAHRFALWAPNAKSVSLVGDFNSWNAAATPMERVEGGVWVCFVEGLQNGCLYKYAVTTGGGRTVFKADPFAAYSQHGEQTASIVWQERDYAWGDGRYMKKRARRDFMTAPMSIYEVHLGSWKDATPDESVYSRMARQLPEYLADMGYTHVEFMPLTEYPYDASWGYQVTGYYAPTSRYGEPEELMALIDALHRRGVGVIMDWVPAHFPKDEHGLALFDGTPLYERPERRMAEHPEWGTLIFDYASPQVKSFLVSSACKFAEVYHIDGIRVDAVSSMLYLNYARKDGEYTPNREGGSIDLDAVDFLRLLNKTLLTNYPGALTVAEESTAYPLVTAPPESGGLGFCLKWDMGFMHDTLDYMALDPLFRSGSHEKLSFSMMYAFSENFILAFSHDEVVHCKRSMLDKMHGSYEQKFASLRALYGYQFAHPGAKLTFMGGEFGQFIEWNYEKGLDWLLLDYPMHAGMQRWCRALNALYTKHSALYLREHSWEGFRWLNVDDRQRSAIAFMRTDGDEHIVCAVNFTPVLCEDLTVGLPDSGTLRLLLSSDELIYGGSGTPLKKTVKSGSEGFAGLPRSARLTLPPLGAVFYSYKVEV